MTELFVRNYAGPKKQNIKRREIDDRYIDRW